MPATVLDIGPVPVCVARAAADYSIPMRALLSVKAALLPTGAQVQRGFASETPYPVNASWLNALARAWRVKADALKHDVCWTARASAYVLRYEINLAGGDFWSGVSRYAVSVPPGQAPRAGDLATVIHDAARLNKLDPDLVSAVVEVESNFQSDARSAKGAVGLMQLMPGTAARYGVTQERDLLVPAINVAAGSRYLGDLSAMFGGDVRLALAAFNAGEGAVIKYGLQIPPFSETRRYVDAVTAIYGPTFRARVYEASLQF